MASDGTITFSTALDNEQMEKELKRAEREVKGLEDKVSKWSGDKSAIEKQMDSANAAIAETEAHVESLKARLAAIPDVTSSADEYRENRDAMLSIGQQIEAANAKMAGQVEESDKLNRQWQAADGKVRSYTERLEAAKARSSELGAEYGEAMRNAKDSTARATKEAEGRFGKLARRVSGLVKSAFVFTVFASALSAVKEHLAETARENDRFAASFATLKATMAGFAAPLVNWAVSALTGLMNILSSMLATLAGLIDSVFRTDLAGSIKASRAAAQAAEREAKAKKKTAKAAKEAAKSIMAFDEINAMQADKSADSDGAEDGGGPLDFDALGGGKIDEALGAIMLILGAALLAVGAILAFSGINIPLGITLMAIGALMVYTAVQEQWDRLPAELQEAISGALLLTGVVLLVLGAVLAFAVPGAQAVGVGMMAAGAALLWTAVALNWESLGPDMQQSVLLLMGIIGAALIVIGAILLLTGAAAPLGVALMAAGAASLAAAIALNWEFMDADMQAAVTGLMVIVSAALLVLGAILLLTGAAAPLGMGLIAVGAVGLAAAVALNWDYIQANLDEILPLIEMAVSAALLVLGAVLCFTGAALPLGVALLAAGAAGLVAAIALNWEKMPQETRDLISEIMVIVGGALLVLGIILVVTGVGIPLGIACILAGIGSMVAGVALNWDFFRDKLAEMWAGVCAWWDSNVAHVFTAQFWQDLWKSMVNGLIWAVNQGLGAFGGFVNSVSDGLSGLLSMAGVDWSWHVQMPQIPYLAQGAVIPPNRKFMAVLGDQTSGNNLEAPESLIRQIVREESGVDSSDLAWAVQQGVAMALMQVLPSMQGSGDGDVTMVLQVGSEELARATEKGRASLLWKGEIKPEVQFV